MSPKNKLYLPLSIEVELIPQRWKFAIAYVVATRDSHPHQRSLKVPGIDARCPWNHDATIGDAVTVLLSRPSKGARRKILDAHSIRDEFLDLIQDSPSADLDLVAFLNKFGATSKIEQDITLHPPSGFWDLQDRLRKALIGELQDFVFVRQRELLLQLEPISDWPYTKLKISGWNTAVNMTAMIDLLNEAKFAICARHDCRRVYKIKSKMPRKYCTTDGCGHLMAVRASRARAAKKQVKKRKR